MGGSTFAIGLVPNYETIGFMAPLTILILRLLQGLAIGGEYGGAATFVAEHSPIGKRGFWTSWIQITAPIAFLLTFLVIYIFKNAMALSAWEDWGWRLPFLISIFMMGISVYIRKNMAESPLFAKAKAEGKTSINPLKESFGKKANLKLVLVALFGITMGLGAISWSTQFYVQTYFTRFLFIDGDQVNTIIIIGILFGLVFDILFAWLSDYIGRKPLIVLSLLLSFLCFRPVYNVMYQTLNLSLKVENRLATKIETQKEPISTTSKDSVVTTTTHHFYTDGTVVNEIKKVQNGKEKLTKTITINATDKWKLIFMFFLLMVIVTMSYGPVAAFLVEMFPLKIRYSSMSLPFHVGYGIFGGLCPVIATYMIQKDQLANVSDYYLSGLNYPLVLIGLSLVIGVLYLKESNELKPIISFPSIPTQILNVIKRYFGIVWIGLGISAAYFGVVELGLPKVNSGIQDDFIFGIIMLVFITPIASIGLCLFGKYALDGEYDG